MLGWKDSEFENRIIIRKECMISQDLSYQIFATIASFYGPSIILLFQYYRIYQVAKARLKMKKQRYQYRIRRRPSFYRTRKESEIKEFPRMAHRVSINPNEEFISSASTAATLPQQSSTSGVYSSSTATEMTTTATTNTTLSTEGTSSVVTINPRKFSKPITSIGSIHDIDFQRKQSIKILTNQNRLDVGATNANEHHKRFSIVQFFTGSSSNEHRKRSDSNLDGERFRMARFDELIDNNDLQSNESSLDDDSTIIIDGPDAPTNIVIYVDDYESTACSSCDATDGHRHSTLSFYRETEFMTTCDEDDDDDEEDDDEDEEIGTNENDDDDDDADENGEESREITETPVKTDQTSLDDDDDDDDDEKDSEKKKSDQQSNVEIIVPELVIQKRSSLRKDDRDDPHHHHHHHHHHHRKLSKSQKRRRRIRKLKFRNKILRFDNGGSSESKQESKAAKTLTIITGVFIICWLPFFVMALVMPLCGDRCHINKYLFDFFVWLGWANSTLNPFLYTIFSPDFRNAFQKLLKRVKNK
ncbi:5-hydroxytryptamine receptor [Sarcoptes scabiei]|uniref:5-hydroxytryptamine receptor n=1 Tax=Sarcoptes scabiei TaxID=52283 RepID=A0A834R923_SARSC|nr:5-hydroxytryptamine receptor [Sarcoptes scabiei]